MSNNHPLPSYISIELALEHIHSTLTPAEAHGVLVGMFCAQADRFDHQVWLEAITPESPYQWEDLDLKTQELFDELISETIQQFEADNFEFELLVMDDETPIQQRTQAIGEWCQGFLTGLGLGGYFLNQGVEQDIGEALSDIIEITKISSAADESEESEKAYAEVIEYIRVAILLIHRTIRDAFSNPPDDFETYH